MAHYGGFSATCQSVSPKIIVGTTLAINKRCVSTLPRGQMSQMVRQEEKNRGFVL